MPKINHCRKNRTDGPRSGGYGSWRSHTKGSNDSWAEWKRMAWKSFRTFTRRVMNRGQYEHVPPKMYRRGYWSNPGFSAPLVPPKMDQ